MKKTKLFLIFSMVIILICPTIPAQAANVYVSAEEKNSTGETKTSVDRNTGTWTCRETGVIYGFNIDGTTGAVIGHNGAFVHHVTVPPFIIVNNRLYIIDTIADRAFNNSIISTFDLPFTIQTIGERAFANNWFMRRINIPDSVLSIGDEAFYNNSALAEVNLSSSLTTIGASSFARCHLHNIHIPDTVSSIGDSAFENNQLTMVTLPNSLTSIGNNIFRNNQLTTVTIPDSVTSIGTGAFRNNYIRTVNLPSSLTSIEGHAFRENELAAVTFPNSLTAIGQYSFSHNRLTSISIPNSVTTIGIGAFSNNHLSQVILPNSLTMIDQFVFHNNHLSTFTIPTSVREIRNSAFSYNNLTTISIPNSVTSISDSAFSHNRLQHVTLPNSLQLIGNFVFSNNYLSNIQIPRSVTTIGNSAFSTNHLTSIFIPNSVTSMGGWVFQNNPLGTIQTDDGNATHLRSQLTTMGNINTATTQLIEASPNRYESDVKMVNNVYSGSTLELGTTPQLKYIFRNNGGWRAHTPTVQWFHNGRMIGQDSTLRLLNIQERHAGIYYAVIDGAVLPNITVNVTTVYPLSTLFPDQNLAKALAEELYGNQNTDVLVTLEELATITNLDVSSRGIQDLTGIQHLVNVSHLNLDNNTLQDIKPLTNLNKLQFLFLNHNQIYNIQPLSALSNLLYLQANNQAITLPEGMRREPTELQLMNRDGSTPTVTFTNGEGNYNNGQLVWYTTGQNQLTWSGPQFSGTVTQNIISRTFSISTFFPDENLAKAIAEELHGNQDTSIITTEDELATIRNLDVNSKGIHDLTGIEYLVDLLTLNLNNNQIQDIGPLTDLNRLQFLLLNDNHINNIRPLSTLSDLIFQVHNQSILLPEGIRREPTELQLFNKDGSIPTVTFIRGEGSYNNGQLIWNTIGENQMTWNGNQFSGTVTQNIKDRESSIVTFFPDENLAKAIAEELHGNPDTSVVTTKEELATIRNLNANNKGIQDLTGIQYLTDVVTLNLNDNQIQDISLLTTLHRLQFLLLNNNQISNISPLSALSNLLILETNNQTISLPETFRGEPTELHLINRDGSTPSFTFIEGAGSYDNGQLVWHTSGQNQLAWSGPQFSGTVTQNVTGSASPIHTFFPDENLAKAIAEELYGNQDTSVVTSEEELAKITMLFINNRNIKDLSGIEHLKNLSVLSAAENHINDIRIVSTLSNLIIYNFGNQTITLPEGLRGEPTELPLLNKDGSTPTITFIQGEGNYSDGQVTWHTAGENQFTWSSPQFSGTVTQNVRGIASPIHAFFPDENLAKAIAEKLYGNPDTSAITTEEELSKIDTLLINNRNIKDLSGIEHLKNLSILNASENHIHDIRILSKLSNLTFYNITNQTITLPDVEVETATPLTILDANGVTPNTTFTVGMGHYDNGQLIWHTTGENRLTWGSGTFSGTVIQQVHLSLGMTISSIFPDENLAKAIAEELYGNPDSSVITTREELAKIDMLLINNRNIKNLSGIEHLTNLSILNAPGNHIHDISILSKLPNLTFYSFGNQTITLPEVEVGTATPLALLDANGETPNITFTAGMGHYENGQLTWRTVGENQFTWGSGAFSGTATQQVQPSLGEAISTIFPDENLAKAIAEEIYSHQDTSALITDEQLLTIRRLDVQQRSIKDLTGIERLSNLQALNVSNNHIQDISMLSHLPNLIMLMAFDQVITLPEGIVGVPTRLTLMNEQGLVPNVTFSVGQGTYADGQLLWTTHGENQLTWNSYSILGTFSGTVIQHVESSITTIADMFPDENFARTIAEKLHGNPNTNVPVTKQELAGIMDLVVPNRNIRSIAGIENLQNLIFFSAEDNQISDISMLSQLPNLVTFNLTKQVITLPNVPIGTPTSLTLLDEKGVVPHYTFIVGQGTFHNNELIWNTVGQNQMHWTENSQSNGFFDGVIIQNAF